MNRDFFAAGIERIYAHLGTPYDHEDGDAFEDLWGEPRISRNVVDSLSSAPEQRGIFYRTAVRKLVFSIRWHPLFNGPAVMSDAQRRMCAVIPGLENLVSLYLDQSRRVSGPDQTVTLLDAARRLESVRALTVVELDGLAAPGLVPDLSTWNLQSLSVSTTGPILSLIIPPRLRSLSLAGTVVSAIPPDLEELFLGTGKTMTRSRAEEMLRSLTRIRRLRLCRVLKDEDGTGDWPNWITGTNLAHLSLPPLTPTSVAAFRELLLANPDLKSLSFPSLDVDLLGAVLSTRPNLRILSVNAIRHNVPENAECYHLISRLKHLRTLELNTFDPAHLDELRQAIAGLEGLREVTLGLMDGARFEPGQTGLERDGEVDVKVKRS